MGLAMFATLFLGVVLAVFLTLGVVSRRCGARPAPAARRPPRGPRDAAALALPRRGGVCVAYVLVVYFALVIIAADRALVAGRRIVCPGSSSRSPS